MRVLSTAFFKKMHKKVRGLRSRPSQFSFGIPKKAGETFYYDDNVLQWSKFHFPVGTAPQVITALREQQFVVVPDKITLECEFNPGKPAAEVRWYKDGREMYKLAKFAMEYSDGKAKLTISSSDTSDSGTYRCEAYNVLGRVYTEGTLKVCSKSSSAPNHRRRTLQDEFSSKCNWHFCRFGGPARSCKNILIINSKNITIKEIMGYNNSRKFYPNNLFNRVSTTRNAG